MKKIKLSFNLLAFCAIAPLLGISLGACAKEMAQPADNIGNIDVIEATKLIQSNSQIVVLDIRTKEEFDAGHIKNAINIDFYTPNFATQIQSLPIDKNYIVYCRSGNRSGQSLAVFRQFGFKSVKNVVGGINVWKEKGLP
jgi:phage shock protein E